MGFGLLAVGLVAMLAGMAGPRSVELPVADGWHVTLFPVGIGLLVLIVGACVLTVSALRRVPTRRTR